MRGALTLVAVVAATCLCAVDSLSIDLAAAGAAPVIQGAAKPPPSTETSIKTGAAVYAKLCRACHGLRGRGDGIAAPPGTKPANLVDAEWKHGGTDAEIFKTIRQGIDPFDVMRPQRGLSDADIWSIIHYLRDLAATAKK